MNKKYGYIKQAPDQRDLTFQHFKLVKPIPVELPPEVDLRGRDCPVFDQGQLGSCVANSLTSLMMHNEDISGSYETLSRLFLYYNTRKLEGDVQDDNGCQIRDAIKSLASDGIASESLWRYDGDQFAVQPPEIAILEARTRVISSYYSLDGKPQTMVDNIRGALAAGHPVSFGMQVYSSFESDTVSKTGIVPVPDPNTEECMGGHCTLIMGYSTEHQWFIVKNSWAETWGDKGYCYIPYQIFFNGLCSDPWAVIK